MAFCDRPQVPRLCLCSVAALVSRDLPGDFCEKGLGSVPSPVLWQSPDAVPFVCVPGQAWVDNTPSPVWHPMGSVPFYVSRGGLRSLSYGLCSAAKSPPAASRSRLTFMHCL